MVGPNLCRIENVPIGVNNATLMHVLTPLNSSDYPIEGGNHFTLRTSMGERWVENMRLENFEALVDLKSLTRVEVLITERGGMMGQRDCYIIDHRVPRDWLINSLTTKENTP